MARYQGPDGRRHHAPHTFASKTDAQRWLDAVGVNIDRGHWLNPVTGDVTLLAYAEGWIIERRGKGGRPLAPRTIETYRHSLRRHIAPTLGTLPLVRSRHRSSGPGTPPYRSA